MKYYICVKDSAKQLQERVAELIELGWQPLGGVSVASYELTAGRGEIDVVLIFVQAMTKMDPCQVNTTKQDMIPIGSVF